MGGGGLALEMMPAYDGRPETELGVLDGGGGCNGAAAAAAGGDVRICGGAGMGGVLSTSFSLRKIASLRLSGLSPMTISSLTACKTSITLTLRLVSSSRSTSSRKPAYPSSWYMP